MTANTGHRVGLLFSHESLTAATEITQENATLLAIDEVNAAGGIDGVPLVPVSAPVGAQPADYREAAEWLCDQERVPLIFGTHMSSTRKAVLPVVESRR
ncbi:MAG: transporter substrate-binding protein, partial [Achromobacter piechaudii]